MVEMVCHHLLPTSSGRIWFATILLMGLCLFGGCWQEVRYDGPKPGNSATSSNQRNRTLPAAEADAAAFGAELAAALATQPGIVASPELPAAAPIASLGEPAPPLDNRYLTAPTAASGLGSLDTRYENSQSSPPPLELEVPVAALPQDNVSREPPASIMPPTTSSAEAPAATAHNDINPAAATPTAADRARTRRIAWNLGSKWSLAALARARGVSPADVAKWLEHSQQLAQSLGTSLNQLPAAAPASGNASAVAMAKYLISEGQRIGREIAEKHGPDHVALFELALKSNVLLVLYEPRSPVSEALGNSLAQAREASGLRAELWQPLLTAITEGRDTETVRRLVFQLHEDVDRSLTDAAEPQGGVQR
jgi:hypothetical protein